MVTISASAQVSPLPACGERSDCVAIRVRGISFLRRALPLTPTLSPPAGRGRRIARGVAHHPHVVPHPEERAVARVSKDEAVCPGRDAVRNTASQTRDRTRLGVWNGPDQRSGIACRTASGAQLSSCLMVRDGAKAPPHHEEKRWHATPDRPTSCPSLLRLHIALRRRRIDGGAMGDTCPRG